MEVYADKAQKNESAEEPALLLFFTLRIFFLWASSHPNLVSYKKLINSYINPKLNTILYWVIQLYILILLYIYFLIQVSSLIYFFLWNWNSNRKISTAFWVFFSIHFVISYVTRYCFIKKLETLQCNSK